MLALVWIVVPAAVWLSLICMTAIRVGGQRPATEGYPWIAALLPLVIVGGMVIAGWSELGDTWIDRVAQGFLTLLLLAAGAVCLRRFSQSDPAHIRDHHP